MQLKTDFYTRSRINAYNSHSQIDYEAKVWICSFCSEKNDFPVNYQHISNVNLPPELLPKYTTIEYKLNRVAQQTPPAIFLYVVDTCLEDQQLKVPKYSLVESLSLLPEELVCLLTVPR